MNLAALILGGGGFASLVGFITFLLSRGKLSADTGLVRTESWEKFVARMEANAERQDRLIAEQDRRIDAQDESLQDLRVKAEEDRRFRFYAIGYIRVLIGWGLAGGGQEPPEPPHQLDLGEI